MANTAVFGIFASQESVSEAIEKLRAVGYRNTDISILLPLNEESKDFGHDENTKAPEGAITGATSGVVVGGVVGWLVGIGALAIPGLGPFIAAGPIISALAGAGGGGIVGGIVGGLLGLGMLEYEVKRYEGRVVKGGILLSVHCDNSEWIKRAKKILKDSGAHDISPKSEANAEANANYARSEPPAPRLLR